MRQVGLGLLVGICAWSSAGPAAAQGGPSPVPPADAPVVASVPGATLVAFDHGGTLCVGLRGEAPASCQPLPRPLFDPDVEGTSVNATQLAYGVTTTAAAQSVDLLEPGGRHTTAPLSRGAYAGRFAGRVRFFLVAVAAQPYRALLRDAQGRVVGAADLMPAPVIGRPVTVRRGTLGGRRWRALLYQTTHLEPTPLDRGRTERLTCVRIAFGAQRSLGEGCSGPDLDPASVSASPREHCDPDGLTLSGMAGSDVRRMDAVLGDGTRRPVALFALPARFSDRRRAYALVLPPGVAVRGLRIVGSGQVHTLRVGQAPGGATCAPRSSNSGSFIIGIGFDVSGPQANSTGPLVARDEGDLLCVGLGTATAGDCRVPPIDPLLPRVETRGSGARRALLAVVPPEVAALRLTLDRGAPITVATIDLPGYAGRYAGLVRAAAVPLLAGTRVYATDELAADGHVLQHVPGPDERPLPHAPAVLARLPGGVTVAASGSCVQVTADAPTRDRGDCRNIDFQPILVAAPCAARRLVVIGRAGRLRVRTDRGVVRARRKGRFAVAIVPRDAALRQPVRLPPAARQCGYALQT